MSRLQYKKDDGLYGMDGILSNFRYSVSVTIPGVTISEEILNYITHVECNIDLFNKENELNAISFKILEHEDGRSLAFLKILQTVREWTLTVSPLTAIGEVSNQTFKFTRHPIRRIDFSVSFKLSNADNSKMHYSVEICKR